MNQIIKLSFLIYIYSLISNNNVLISQELEPTEINKKVKDCIVMIEIHFKTINSISQGSGVVVDERGVIVTNYHLLLGEEYENITTIRIINSGDTVTKVREILEDKLNDILILKVDDYSFPSITWAENQNYSVGQTVYTLSSPLGFENSLSVGIISGLNRKLNYHVEENSFYLENLIQFTAGIDHGSSGGALLNDRGELIGIVVAGSSNNFLNFAIPISLFWNTYIKSIRGIYQQRLDVLNEDYQDRINWELLNLPDDINLYSEGNKAFERRDFVNVIYYYSLFLKNNIGDDSLYYQRGTALLAFNIDTLAVNDFGKISKTDFNKSDLLFDLGCYYKNSMYNIEDTSFKYKADEFFRESIKADSNYYPTYLELSSLYFNDFKNFDSAIKIVSRAISIKNIGHFYFQRSCWNGNNGRTKEELKDLNKAIQFRYNDTLLNFFQYSYDTTIYFPIYYIKRGNILYSLKKFQQAINDFTMCINIEKGEPNWAVYTDDATFFRGLSYYYLKDYKNALVDMESLVAKSMYLDELVPKIKLIKNKLE